jgi:hypothetical protein
LLESLESSMYLFEQGHFSIHFWVKIVHAT